MIRFILVSILLTILLRSLSRLWAGVMRGMQGDGPRVRQGGAHVQHRSVQMARDPVCGTFVVPDRAVTLQAGGTGRIYFCSAECRDKFRAQSSSHAAAHGRTA